MPYASGQDLLLIYGIILTSTLACYLAGKTINLNLWSIPYFDDAFVIALFYFGRLFGESK